MDINNSCGICLSIYDIKEKRPLLLPCSHSFCQACLQVLESRGDKACSYCRQSWGRATVQDLLCCSQLIPSTDGDHKKNFTMCEKHENDEISMWCQTCSCPICLKCLRASHQTCDWVLVEEMQDSLREKCDKMAAELSKMAAGNRATVENIDSFVDCLMKCRDEQTSWKGSAETKVAECARLNQAAEKLKLNEFQKRLTDTERIMQQLQMSESASANTLLFCILKAFLATEDGKSGTFISKLQELMVNESPSLANHPIAESSLTAPSSQKFETDALSLSAQDTCFPVLGRASPNNNTATITVGGFRVVQNERVDIGHVLGRREDIPSRNFLLLRKPAAANSKMIYSSNPRRKIVQKKAVSYVIERSTKPDRPPLPQCPQHLNNQSASTTSTVQDGPPFLNGTTWCIKDNISVAAAATALRSVVFPSEIRITDFNLNGNQLVGLLTSVSMTPCNLSLKLVDAFFKPSQNFASVSGLSSQGKTWARVELLVRPVCRCTLTEFWGHLDDRSMKKLPRSLKVVGLVIQDKKDMDILNQLIEVDSGQCLIKRDWHFLKKIHLSVSRGFPAEHFKVSQKTRSLFETGGSTALNTAPDDAEVSLHLNALDSDDLHWGRQVLERVAETGSVRELFLHDIRLSHHDLRKFLRNTGNLLSNRASVTIHLPGSYRDRQEGLWIIKNCLTVWDL